MSDIELLSITPKVTQVEVLSQDLLDQDEELIGSSDTNDGIDLCPRRALSGLHHLQV